MARRKKGFVAMGTKEWRQRWTETIWYLNDKFPHAFPKIGDHISRIAGEHSATISNEIALGSTRGVHKDTAANKNVRKALRGLLLCQRVYFSDLWASKDFQGSNIHPEYRPFNANWKALSLNTWGMRCEASILSGIGMFATVQGATARDVSKVAKKGPPSGRQPPIAGDLTLSRDNFPLRGDAETPYMVVLAWLLKAGVISLRWYMRNVDHHHDTYFKLKALGDGEEIWSRATPFIDTSVLPAVEAGYVVNMSDDVTTSLDHQWVISNGDGTICGVKNREVNRPDEQVIKAYTNNGRLRTQFETRGRKARMIKINPLDPPNRM